MKIFRIIGNDLISRFYHELICTKIRAVLGNIRYTFLSIIID